MSARILIADDDDSVRAALAALLESEGYAVVCAANGDEALAAARREPFRAALVDLNMPVKNGWTVCAELAEVAPYLPIVIITAQSGAAAKTWPSLVVACLLKPLDLGELLGVVAALCQRTARASMSATAA